MSYRVRMAHALDAIEKVVNRCLDSAVDAVENADCFQYELKYDIVGAVREASELYCVDFTALKREALAMLRDGLQRNLRPLCEVRYVKSYEKDGELVGMMARLYTWPSHMRRSA